MPQSNLHRTCNYLESRFKRAIALKPGYATAHHWYAVLLTARGRFVEAHAEIKQAWEFDPVSPIISANVGWIHYCARDYETAIEQHEATLKREPSFAVAHAWLGDAFVAKGRFADAVEEYQAAPSLSTPVPGSVGGLGYAYARSGSRAEAMGLLAKLKAQRKRGYAPATAIALIYAGMGEPDQAIDWLATAYDEHASGLSYTLKVDPRWDSLRSDSRFDDLLRRMGLEP